MKRKRKEVVDRFMENFIKEIKVKYPDFDERKDPMNAWMLEQFRFRLERLLTIIIIRNPTKNEDEIFCE